jgi:hypothetical protein
MLSPVDIDYALAQVERLAGLDGFPKRDAAVLELARALMHAPNVKAAENYIGDVIRHATKCPKVKDVLDKFKPLPSPFEAPQNTGCGKCGGTGWQIVKSPRYTPEGIQYEGAKRCSCRPIPAVR